jgi:ABC-type Fe3+-citrate transport system substrate-binding protein
MKKLSVIVASLMMLFVLVACSNSKHNKPAPTTVIKTSLKELPIAEQQDVVIAMRKIAPHVSLNVDSQTLFDLAELVCFAVKGGATNEDINRMVKHNIPEHEQEARAMLDAGMLVLCPDEFASLENK